MRSQNQPETLVVDTFADVWFGHVWVVESCWRFRNTVEYNILCSADFLLSAAAGNSAFSTGLCLVTRNFGFRGCQRRLSIMLLLSKEKLAVGLLVQWQVGSVWLLP